MASAKGGYFGSILDVMLQRMKPGDHIEMDELTKLNPAVKSIFINSFERTKAGIKIDISWVGNRALSLKGIKKLDGAEISVRYLNDKVKELTSNEATYNSKPLKLYLGYRMFTDEKNYKLNKWWDIFK